MRRLVAFLAAIAVAAAANGQPAPSAAKKKKVTLCHEGWPPTTPDDTARDDHLGYWSAYLEDLAALLSG